MKSLLVIPIALMIHSCGPPAIKGGFESANPAAKMYAIETAVQQHDRAAIPRIVEQLDSDDPAVRAMAIAALKRLTGETYGYNDVDPPAQRREAIARWVQAVKSGEIALHSDSPAPARPASDSDHIANPEAVDPHG